MNADLDRADTILTGGKIVTLDSADTRASAMALAGERILAVGGDDAIRGLAHAATRTIELRGRVVIPGIVDAHAHLEREGLKGIRPSLEDARSVADVLSVVASQAASRPAGEWIITMPVGQPPHYFDGPRILAEDRMPSREELDRAAPDHPVCIPGPFGFWGRPPSYTALNTLALTRCGVTAETRPACAGVDIELDPATGEPSGLIVEHNGRPTIEFDLLREMPAFTYEERLLGLRQSIPLYHAVGITSVYEGHGSGPESLAMYRHLCEEGALTVRTSLCVSPAWADPGESLTAMRDWLSPFRGRGIGDEWLRVSGVYIGIGGDPAFAELARAALPNTGWSGYVEWANNIDDYGEYVRQAAANDLRVHTVVGNRLSEVLSVLEDVDGKWPLTGRRWVLEHVTHVGPRDIGRILALGLEIETIPVFMLWKDTDSFLSDDDDGETLVPLRNMLDAGVPVCAGTDNIPPTPFWPLWAMISRVERATGRVRGPGQRIGRLDALRLLTVNAARLSFEEQMKGTLEPGKLADLAVLSADYLTIPEDEIPALRSVLTMVGGRVVHIEPWE